MAPYLRHLLHVLLLATLVVVGAPARADEVEVFSLRHRSADQVIPILQPLVEPGGAITGMQNQVIVRASRRNIEQLRQALAAIDTVPRRLVISVRQDAAGSVQSRGGGVTGSIGSGGADIDVRVRDNASVGTERVAQQVQAVEGVPAFISVGQTAPVQTGTVTQTPWGTVVQGGTTIQSFNTGFQVVPRVSGDRVTLEVSTQRDRPTGYGTAQTQGISTVASGRLGEWIELGGVGQSGAVDQRGILSGSRTIRSDNRSVFVRVDELR
jgi:type II secretory pathway component GspD/PulD (secretin)